MAKSCWKGKQKNRSPEIKATRNMAHGLDMRAAKDKQYEEQDEQDALVAPQKFGVNWTALHNLDESIANNDETERQQERNADPTPQHYHGVNWMTVQSLSKLQLSWRSLRWRRRPRSHR